MVDAFGIKIGELPASKVYLFKEQSHKGRCIVASKFHVSRATLYNTMDLLTDAHLVIRHKFDNSSQYEKSFNMTTHFHRICMSCGSVTEVQDEKLRQVIENAHSKGFSIAHTSLYMYGMCSKCMAAKRRRENKEKKLREQRNNK